MIRLDKSSLDKFRHENTLLKEFHTEGIKVYRALESPKTIDELSMETGLSVDRLQEIVDFMLANDMIREKTQEPTSRESPEDTFFTDSYAEDEHSSLEEYDVSVPATEEKSEIDSILSDSEKKIKERFGDKGLRVFSLIDGVRNANDIMREANVSEGELMEILNFLESEGIITLEQQDQRWDSIHDSFSDDASMPPLTAEPLEELDISKEGDLVDLGGDLIPIDLPFRTSPSALKVFPVLMELSIKYGKEIVDLYNSIDGFKDVVHLALERNLTLPKINELLAELGRRNLVLFRTLTRKEVKARYGDDGYIIYKKYGIEGVFLYELIGQTDNLNEMVNRSGLDPKRTVEIFIFIHKILGIDIPISKKILYKQLGISD